MLLIESDVAEVAECHGEVFRVQYVSELWLFGTEPRPLSRGALTG
jgi:hypothetical protein